MNQELGIHSSYTLEASLSGSEGYHFSITDLQTMGRDFCLSLLQIDTNQLELGSDITEPLHTFFAETNLKKSSNDKRNLEEEDDSFGSESNPSEGNISESEALQLLKTHVVPLRRKRRTKNKKKGINKLDKNSDKTARRLQSCSVIQIGNVPIQENANAPIHKHMNSKHFVEKRSL